MHERIFRTEKLLIPRASRRGETSRRRSPHIHHRAGVAGLDAANRNRRQPQPQDTTRMVAAVRQRALYSKRALPLAEALPLVGRARAHHLRVSLRAPPKPDAASVPARMYHRFTASSRSLHRAHTGPTGCRGKAPPVAAAHTLHDFPRHITHPARRRLTSALRRLSGTCIRHAQSLASAHRPPTPPRTLPPEPRQVQR